MISTVFVMPDVVLGIVRTLAKTSSAVLFEFLYYVHHGRAFYYGSEVLCDVLYTQSTFEHTHLATNLNSAVSYIQGAYILYKWKVEVWSVVGIFMLTGSVSDTLVGLTGN